MSLPIRYNRELSLALAAAVMVGLSISMAAIAEPANLSVSSWLIPPASQPAEQLRAVLLAF